MSIKRKSFLETISKYIIEIPIIQREYAQGRTSQRVTFIREKFVKDICDSFIDKIPMHLGFVYGKVLGKDNLRIQEINQKSLESILGAVKGYANVMDFSVNSQVKFIGTETEKNTFRFIPLDGQQRLTTLFLFFWYVNLRQNNEEELPWLSHFKYRNRKTTLSFFEKISQPIIIAEIREKLRNIKDGSFKDLIEESHWFLRKWKLDISIDGMLEMLNSIHLEFKKREVVSFEEFNLEEAPFSFDFLDLDAVEQTDELYVKMNARGKQLTDFEHFKAWLQDAFDKKHLKDNEVLDKNDFLGKEILAKTQLEEKAFLEIFWKKLDTSWLTYFWQNLDCEFNALDDFIYNFLKNLALMHYFATNDESKISDDNRVVYDLIRNSEKYEAKKISYIPLENYIKKVKISEEQETFEIRVFNIDSLQFMEKVLDKLLDENCVSKYQNILNEKVTLSTFVKDSFSAFFLKSKNFTPSIPDSVYYYNFLRYVIDDDINDDENFEAYMRISRNLIYNTYIQNPQEYFSAFQQVNELCKYKNEMVYNFVNREYSNQFFNNNQYEEEIRKLELFQIKVDSTQVEIAKNTNWKDEIIKLENHSYFYGQINFIFNLAKDEFDIFKVYAKLLDDLFSESLLDSKDFVLQKALLTKGDYLVPTGKNHTFCKSTRDSLRSRNDNWRKVFNNETKIIFLKHLLDDLHSKEIDDNFQGLQNIIDEYNKQKNINWESYFVRYPLVLKKCFEMRYFDNDDIRILPGSSILAYHLELRSLSLKNKLDEIKFNFGPFLSLDYFWQQYTNNLPGIQFKHFEFQENKYNLIIKFSITEEQFFNLKFVPDEKNKIMEIPDLIVEELVNIGFSLNDNALEKQLHFEDIDFNPLINKLSEIFDLLKKVPNYATN